MLICSSILVIINAKNNIYLTKVIRITWIEFRQSKTNNVCICLKMEHIIHTHMNDYTTMLINFIIYTYIRIINMKPLELRVELNFTNCY